MGVFYATEMMRTARVEIVDELVIRTIVCDVTVFVECSSNVSAELVPVR